MENTARVIATLRSLLQSRALKRTPDENQCKEAERALLAYDAEQALKLSNQMSQEPLVGTQASDQAVGYRGDL